MREEDALRNYCLTMIVRVQSKQPRCSGEERREIKHKGGGGGRGRERTAPGRQSVAGDELGLYRGSSLPLPDCTHRDRHQSSPRLKCQGPEVQLVPIQLMSMLRLKAVQEKMRRAAEVELHDPAECSECRQEQASLALRSFIWRKKTQLQYQTLTARLNTRMSRQTIGVGQVSQSPPMPLTGYGRNYLVKICGYQQYNKGVAFVVSTEEDHGEQEEYLHRGRLLSEGGCLAGILLPGHLKLLCCRCSSSKGFWDGRLVRLLLPLGFLLLKSLKLYLKT
ncbi:hypothetical protein INR49_024746 [Caranx melampygus]|nr:hypothetical protein INR49_024746 [Caranx melampygus]